MAEKEQTKAINPKTRIAVVGGGVSGLTVAWLLRQEADVTLFEANHYIGGHTNTIELNDAELGNIAVDTGFIVFNDWNYPLLNKLFDRLGVVSQDTGMSFSFSVNQGEFEYCGSDLNGLFAQRSNLLRPGYYRLLMEIVRFNRVAKRALENATNLREMTIGEFLEMHRFSPKLSRYYLFPMAAAIWSCPVDSMRNFPAFSMLSFFQNHGLLNIKQRPQWKTLVGGSQQYVKRMLQDLSGKFKTDERVKSVSRSEGNVAGEVTVVTTRECRYFDQVVFACHADQAHAVITDLNSVEDDILSSFQYQENTAVLHSDASIMPVRYNAWAAWNYHAESMGSDMPTLAVTYWMNRLQHIPSQTPYLVTLNPHRDIAADKIHRTIRYTHPVFDSLAIAAQQKRNIIQGCRNSWYCGAYWANGFHEDGVRSAVELVESMGVQTCLR